MGWAMPLPPCFLKTKVLAPETLTNGVGNAATASVGDAVTAAIIDV